MLEANNFFRHGRWKFSVGNYANAEARFYDTHRGTSSRKEHLSILAAIYLSDSQAGK